MEEEQAGWVGAVRLGVQVSGLCSYGVNGILLLLLFFMALMIFRLV